jgi:septum site-determining protein MinC
MLWDEPDTRLYYGTLRSGQKIETEHSLVVFGDVNSGAEVIAGGDIVILGTLRGIAHAGAYDESGGGRVIFSLNLQPTQLRIGLVISRGSAADDLESTPRGGIPEIARVQSNLIVVEPYQSRTVWSRRRE